MSRSHDELACEVRAYLDARTDRRVTLAQLQQEFHVSGTLIKAAYRERFGASLYADTRARKMHVAARMLRETKLPVQEIAALCGYENAGKFTAAFRAVHGVTPRAYRAACRH